MKVRLLRDCLGPNPDYDENAAAAALQNGKVYTVLPERTRPAGIEIETPTCHRLCRVGVGNLKPCAEPIDDEAKAAVDHWFKTVHEPGKRNIALRYKAVPTGKNGTKKPRNANEEWVCFLAKRYGLTGKSETTAKKPRRKTAK